MSQKNDTIIKVELKSQEWALIFALRNKFRFGEIVVIMRDGVPQRIKQIEIFEDLNKPIEQLSTG